MKGAGRRCLTVAGVIVAIGLMAGGVVAAPEDFTVEVVVPEEATVGDPVEIEAALRSAGDGQPVPGALISFHADAEFAGVVSDIELGQATTNEIGVASFRHAFSQLRTYHIYVEVVDEPGLATEPVRLAVLFGRQLHEVEEGVDIPGVGAGTVTVIIASVWAIMIVAAFWVIAMARAGDEGATPSRARFANVAVLITGIMIVTAVGLVVLLVRSPETHHNLNPAGYDRTAVAYVEASYEYPGLGAAGELPAAGIERGRALFLIKGCASCHGIRAEGTAAASSPAGVSLGWLETVVRDGIGGLMPSFSAAELSASDIQDLHDFLVAAGEALPVAPATEVAPGGEAAPGATTPPAAAGEVAAPSFTVDVAPIFQQHCAACHGESGGWSAADYDSVLTTGEHGPVVVAGDPEQSVLAQKVTGTQTFGDPMPPSESLDPALVQVIVDWIAAGALE